MSKPGRYRFAWVCVLCLLGSASPCAAALNANEKKLLAAAEAALKQGEVNLKLAEDAAGPGNGALQGSKARLVQTRLGQAKQSVDAVAGALEPLPPADAQVQAARKRFDAATAGIAALEARLKGKPAPPPADDAPRDPPDEDPAAPPPPAGAEVRLDFRHEKEFKDAQSYLDEVDGHGAAAAEVVKQVEAEKDANAIDHTLIQSAVDAIANGRRRAGLVKGRLDKLPPNGRGVAGLKARYDESVAGLDAAEKVIAPLHKKLAALLDPANYPKLNADVNRLQQLGRTYGDAGVFARDRERAVALLQEGGAARAESERVAKAYAPLIRQKTPAGDAAGRAVSFFRENYAAFEAAAAKLKADLPAEIEQDLAEIGRMADEAVAEEKPLFFTRGIPDRVARTEGKVALLKVLDADGADAVQAKVDAAKVRLGKREGALKDVIIAANELPPDRYAGPDKEALAQRAVQAWQKIQPDAEVLAVRFPSEQWERDVRLRLENRTWRAIDRSKLQAQLLVKHDAKLAVIRPINLWTDHVNNDKLTAVPLDGAKDELPPQRYVLIEKVGK